MSQTIGQTLQERYRIDGILAQGGMGAVYRATDQTFGTTAAIKENLGTNAEAQEQFRHEADVLHQLRHPNLPRVTDHFVIPGQGQYLVMDYVDGKDLNEVLAKQKVVPESQALEWVGQVLEALAYLHSQNVIHRDVKPANIKITPEGQLFLLDLGLAKRGGPDQETAAGARGVTPGFAPPEQYGQGRTDARSDVYAAGATLYTLLTGKAPPDALELMAGQAQLLPPRQLSPEVSTEVEAAVLRALQPSAAERFQTAAEFHAALSKPQTVEEPREEPHPPQPTSPLAGRRAGLWLAGALLAVLVLVLVVWQPLAPRTAPGDKSVVPTDALTAEEHFRRGNDLIEQGQLEQAVEEYHKALELDPENVDALTNLGVVHYNLGQLDEAVEQYSKAIELAPGDADIHSNLAAAYVQMSQLDRALEEYEKAVELNPSLAEAHFGLGVVYAQQGRIDQAIQAFEKFQQLDTGRDPMASDQAEQYLQQLKGQ